MKSFLLYSIILFGLLFYGCSKDEPHTSASTATWYKVTCSINGEQWNDCMLDSSGKKVAYTNVVLEQGATPFLILSFSNFCNTSNDKITDLLLQLSKFNGIGTYPIDWREQSMASCARKCAPDGFISYHNIDDNYVCGQVTITEFDSIHKTVSGKFSVNITPKSFGPSARQAEFEAAGYLDTLQVRNGEFQRVTYSVR